MFEVSEHSWLPVLSTWRRSSAFLETPSTEASTERGTIALHITRWLAEAPAGLGLHLVIKSGGAHRSHAWLGLSMPDIGPGCRSQLAEAADDLGEALDAWGLFGETPQSGPRYARSFLGWRPHTPHRRVPLGAPGNSLLEAMSTLGALSVPRALRIDVRSAGASPDLLNEAEHARNRLKAIIRHGPRFVPAQELFQQGHVSQKLDRLVHDALTCAIRIRLHGAPPKRLVRGIVEQAVSSTIGLPGGFSPSAWQAFAASGQATSSALSALTSAGGCGPVDGGPGDMHDMDIPF